MVKTPKTSQAVRSFTLSEILQFNHSGFIKFTVDLSHVIFRGFFIAYMCTYFLFKVYYSSFNKASFVDESCSLFGHK